MNPCKSYITFIALIIILIITITITLNKSKESFETIEIDRRTHQNKEEILSAADNALTEGSKDNYGIEVMSDSILEDYVKNAQHKSAQIPDHELFDNTNIRPTISEGCKVGSNNFDEPECRKEILAVKKYQELRKLMQYIRLYALSATLNKCNKLHF